jgi:hypothetical protein
VPRRVGVVLIRVAERQREEKYQVRGQHPRSPRRGGLDREEAEFVRPSPAVKPREAYQLNVTDYSTRIGPPNLASRRTSRNQSRVTQVFMWDEVASRGCRRGHRVSR